MQVPMTGVIVTCYNVEKWIERTLHSALAQTYPVKIICVDDCSTDNTLALLREMQAKNPGRIVLLEHSKNLKQGAALNTALDYVEDFNKRATRVADEIDYIAFLDADDLFEPTKVQVCVEALEKDRFHGEHPQHAQMAYTNGWQIGPNGERYKAWVPDGHFAPTADELLLNPEMSPSQCVVRAANRLRFNAAIVPNDHEYFLSLRERGHFIYIDEKLSHYRRHPSQMSGGRQMWADGFRVAYDTFRRDRGHYRYRTFVKRFAVILYRLGEHDRKQHKYLAWAGRWIAAAILDPWRAVKTAVGAR